MQQFVSFSLSLIKFYLAFNHFLIAMRASQFFSFSTNQIMIQNDRINKKHTLHLR